MTIKKGQRGFTIRVGKKKLAALLTILDLYNFEADKHFKVVQMSETYKNYLKVLNEWR